MEEVEFGEGGKSFSITPSSGAGMGAQVLPISKPAPFPLNVGCLSKCKFNGSVSVHLERLFHSPKLLLWTEGMRIEWKSNDMKNCPPKSSHLTPFVAFALNYVHKLRNTFLSVHF